MIIDRPRKRFKKPCRRCNELFRPTGRDCRFCNKCNMNTNGQRDKLMKLKREKKKVVTSKL